MEFFIRPFKERDIRGLNEIRRMRGVRETIPALASESLEFTEAVAKAVPVAAPNLSAVVRENGTEILIGNALLRLCEKPKMRHTASLAIVVHTEYQNMGIGRALHLYESLGFEREGLLRRAYTEGGRYGNIVVMARLREA